MSEGDHRTRREEALTETSRFRFIRKTLRASPLVYYGETDAGRLLALQRRVNGEEIDGYTEV
jgi:hypothetical protein